MPQLKIRLARIRTISGPKPGTMVSPPVSRISASPRISIGYVSDEIRNHVVGAQLIEVLELHDRSTFECLKYSTQLTNTSHATIAKASGTVSAVSGSFATDLASVTSNDAHLNINGTPAPACFGI